MLSPHKQKAKLQIEDKIRRGIYTLEKVDCCICGGDNFKPVAFKDRYGLYTPITICRDCGLMQINPRMTEESYRQFYQNEYTDLYVISWDNYFQKEYDRSEGIKNFIEASVGCKIKDKFIVEIGCGLGGTLAYFKEIGNEIYGFDPIGEFVQYCKDKGLNVNKGDISKIEELDRPIDILILSHLIEHFVFPVKILSRLKKYLSPNTLIYILTPSIKNTKNFYGFCLQNAHTFYFSLDTLINLMNKSGFKLVYGDEVINAIFKMYNSRERNERPLVNDYPSAMRKLREINFKYAIRLPFWFIRRVINFVYRRLR